MFYDQIALEIHDFSASEAERIQNSNHWVVPMNAEGPQLPRQQRPSYAMSETKQLHKTNS